MAFPLKFCLLVVIGFFFFITPLSGQWTLYGQVLDATSGEGLAYVNIRLDRTTLGTTSDQKGNFKIEGLTEDQYGIIFSMIGFQTIRMDQISSENDPVQAEML